VIRFSCKGGTSLALPVHNSNLEDCFRLGRNYTLAVTETVRRSELLHLISREYPAGDTNVKRNYSSMVPDASVRLAADPGPAWTMNRSEMPERCPRRKTAVGGHAQAELVEYRQSSRIAAMARGDELSS
jgi:hypothetical protein